MATIPTNTRCARLLTSARRPLLLQRHGSRRDGVEIPAQLVHLTLELAVDDQQVDHESGQVHGEDDREDEWIGNPDPEVQRESLHPGVPLRAMGDGRHETDRDQREDDETP